MALVVVKVMERLSQGTVPELYRGISVRFAPESGSRRRMHVKSTMKNGAVYSDSETAFDQPSLRGVALHPKFDVSSSYIHFDWLRDEIRLSEGMDVSVSMEVSIRPEAHPDAVEVTFKYEFKEGGAARSRNVVFVYPAIH